MVLAETRTTHSSTGKLNKIGIGVLRYSARASAMMDAWLRSPGWDVDLYIFDKQNNPQFKDVAVNHWVAENFNSPEEAIELFGPYQNEISFIMPGGEGPILADLRNKVEAELGIPCICPTLEYAIEGSKFWQRDLIASVCPEANPRYKVFDPCSNIPLDDVRKQFDDWIGELREVAIKPVIPGYGKGVGVSGDHFNTSEEAWNHFLSIYQRDENKPGGAAIVEKKLEGEEFSLEFLSDGRILVPTYATRDYKRRYDNDEGENTGGMGSWKDETRSLPFMTGWDWREALIYTNQLFRALREKGYNPGLRGVPMYMAFIATKDGVKILEINSRLGDPEAMTWLRLLKTGFVDICLDMVNGTLKTPEFENKAGVVTYLVRPDYGGGKRTPEDTTIDITEALKVAESYGDQAAIYLGAVGVRPDGTLEALGSRNIALCGYADTIEESRYISRGLIPLVKGDLESREDIASPEYIERCINHMQKLRV